MNDIVPHDIENVEPGDLYGILGVSPDASQEEIRKAYQRAANKYHPDKGEIGADDKFKKVQRAYSILKYPQKRAVYDATGFYDKEQDDRIKAASSIVFHLFNNLIDSPMQDIANVDIIGVAVDSIKENIAKCRKGIAFHEKKIKKLKKDKKRAKGEILQNIFEKKIEVSKDTVKELKTDIIIYNMAIKIVKSCSYDYDKPDTFAPSVSSGYDPYGVPFSK